MKMEVEMETAAEEGEKKEGLWHEGRAFRTDGSQSLAATQWPLFFNLLESSRM